jgi:epoxide hydrolase-like predicted phosphatase
MANTPIKFIIFDIGNVLFVDTEGVFDEMFGKDKLSKAKQKKYTDKIHLSEKGECTTKELLQTMVDVYHLKMTPRQVEEFMIETALIEPMWKLFNDLGKHYQTAILTNNQKNWPNMQADFLGINLKKFKIFNSSKLGMCKPNRNIYEFVMKSLEAKPEEILFVDDRIYNLEQPKKLGWKTIQFDGDMTKVFSALKKLGIQTKI